MKRRPSITSLLRWLVCGLLLLPCHSAHAFKRSTTPEGHALYWNTFPIPYHLNSRGTPDAPKDATFSAIRASFLTWSQQRCTCISFLDGGLSSETTLGYDPKKPTQNLNLIIFQTKSWDHAPQAVAVTSTIFKKKDGEIVAFDMELNNVHFYFSLDGKPRNGRSTMDIQNTVTHEVGHVIGLDHSPNPQATMFAAGQPGETSKRRLLQDDINGLCEIYPKSNGCLDQKPQSLTSGCGCQSSTPSPPLPLLLLLWLAASLLWRRSHDKGLR